MITPNEKILGKADGSQNVHHEVFSSHLANHGIMLHCCRAVSDDRFEVQNDPTCTNIGFSISALGRQNMERDNKIFTLSAGCPYIMSKAFITSETLF